MEMSLHRSLFPFSLGVIWSERFLDLPQTIWVLFCYIFSGVVVDFLGALHVEPQPLEVFGQRCEAPTEEAYFKVLERKSAPSRNGYISSCHVLARAQAPGCPNKLDKSTRKLSVTASRPDGWG